MYLEEALDASRIGKAYHPTLFRVGRVVETVREPGKYPYYTLASLDSTAHKARYRNYDDLAMALDYKTREGWVPA